MSELAKEIIDAGERIASDLMNALVSKTMGHLGGHIVKPVSEYDHSDLIQKYLDEKISSVEAMYMAMKRAESGIVGDRVFSDKVCAYCCATQEKCKACNLEFPDSFAGRLLISVSKEEKPKAL